MSPSTDNVKRYNIIAFAIILGLVGTIAISALLIAPAWKKLGKLGTEIATVQGTADAAKATKENMENGKKFLQNSRDIVDRVNVAIPSESKVPAILVMLDDYAKRNGVQLSSFQPAQVLGTATGQSGSTPGASEAGQSSIEVTADYSGRYSSLINFFYTLENSLRLVDVKGFSISSGGTTNNAANLSSGSGDTLTGKISFRAYYMPVDAAVTAAANIGN
jgi:hypothetical protein